MTHLCVKEMSSNFPLPMNNNNVHCLKLVNYYGTVKYFFNFNFIFNIIMLPIFLMIIMNLKVITTTSQLVSVVWESWWENL